MAVVTATNKDQRIETARGLAVLLMVAGHVIGYSDDQGLQAPDDSGLRRFYTTMQFIRLPLFTVISGYVYAKRPVTRDALRVFAQGKLRRLALPLLGVGGLFYALQASVPGVNDAPAWHEAWRLLVYPYAHFWYLQSLLVVFLLVACLDALGALRSRAAFVGLLAGSIALMYTPLNEVELLSTEGSVFLLPFFMWGIGLARYRQDLLQHRALPIAALVAAISITLRQLGLFGYVDISTIPISGVTMLSAFASTLVVVYACPVVRPLARIGHYAYSIYLLHVFGTAAVRIALERMGVQALWIHFAAGMSIGVLAPILADLCLDRWLVTRWLFLGRRVSARAQATNPHTPPAPQTPFDAGGRRVTPIFTRRY